MSFFDEKIKEARGLSLVFLQSQAKTTVPMPLGVIPDQKEVNNDVGILGYLQQKLGEQIYIYDTLSGENKNGFFERYDDSSTPHPHINIYYNHDELNTCWRRFVIAKEISHAFLGLPQVNYTALLHEIERLFNKLLRKQVIDKEDKSEEAVEVLAYYTAIELLIPWHKDYGMKALDMYNNGSSTMEIATLYRIPEMVISFYVDDYIGKHNLTF